MTISDLKEYWWLISTFILPFSTYLVGLYKKKNKEQDTRLTRLEKMQDLKTEALKIMLQSELTKMFYKYEESQTMPSYAYKNWLNLLHVYESLGGNDYIHELAIRVREFKIIKK